MKKTSEYLRELGGELYTKAIKAALKNENYDGNYMVDSLSKAWTIAVLPHHLKGGLKEWAEILDRIKDIPDGRCHVKEPSSGFEEVH